MRLVIQRVTHAAVTVGAERVSAIGPGLLVLVGVECGDTPDDVAWLAKKTAGLRIFNDADGVMNRSVTEAGGRVLAVSPRTGNRPSYIRAAGHDLAVPLYEAYCEQLSQLLGSPVGRGRFGADMAVELCNDGPVTIIIDSRLRE